MYKIELTGREIELIKSALSFTKEYGYSYAFENNESEMIEEYNEMDTLSEKLSSY